MLKSKDLLGLKELSSEEILLILDTAAEMKKIILQNVKKTPHLQNKSVVTLFYENSTRTRMSFELAAKFMSAVVSSVSAQTSSIKKGESLIDTGLTLDALSTDIIIIRHNQSGSPHLLAKNVKASVINGGDGTNEHPTQALLDMFTLKEKFGSLKGLEVLIAGDIKHSRVAKSNIYGLSKMGAKIRLVAPPTLLPFEIDKCNGVKVYSDLKQGASGADALMALRIQLERQEGGLFPSIREYSKFFGLNDSIKQFAKENAIVMHPGPMNRGVEITANLATADFSKIEEQVTNGVAIRMAILFLLTRKQK